MNYLLGDDMQAALALRGVELQAQCAPRLGPSIDVLATSTATGVDWRLARDTLRVVADSESLSSLALERIASKP